MPRLLAHRLDDILDAIAHIEKLATRGAEAIAGDRIASAAFERFVEIISEASRHIPDDLKQQHADIEWRRLADIGNHLRHGYDRIDPAILWNLVDAGKLAALRQAVLAIRDAR